MGAGEGGEWWCSWRFGLYQKEVSALVIKQSFFSFQNIPKLLDPSYKMDLDLWDCLGRVIFVLQQNFVGLI